MKYFNIVFFLFVLVSCSSTKSAVKETPKVQSEAQVISENKKEETPATNEVTETPKEVITKTDEEEIEIEVEEIPIEPKPGEHVSNTGNVNYKGFKNNRKEHLNYIALLGKFMPNSNWSKEDKLAYWINVYNTLTVDLILRNYPLKSIKDIKTPWEQRLWKLGEKWYNLNEIEHQILRKMDEPRIHFAIVCASYSCPKLLNKAYTAKNLEAQLTEATRNFLKDPERNNLTENNIKLSKIFKWFAKDFKTNGSLIDFLNTYSDITIVKNAKKSYKDYNWDLNE